MQLGLVGLGRMGANMARRLMRDGHEIVAFDVNPEAVKTLEGEGATGASSLADLAAKLSAPRTVWVMVPAGEITEQTVKDVAAELEPGDAIVDGGNSYYHDDIRRAALLREQGIDFVDCGTSGGVFGLERGTTHVRFSSWPPNCLRIADRTLSPKSPRPREEKRS